MSPLPPEFVGLWERTELVVDGRVISDAGRSFWFQAGSRFLDVRAAGGGLRTEAFGGVTSWREATATLHWTHEVDLHPGSVDDSGAVEWVNGDLIEHGSVELGDDVIAYREVWRRRSAPGDRVLIADRVGGVGRLACCGFRGALTIDDRPTGTHQGGVFSDRGWALIFDIVQGLPLSSAPVGLDDAAAVGSTIEAWGTCWQVAEQRSCQNPGDR